MAQTTFVINEVINIDEDNTFSLINEDLKNHATLTIKNGEIKMYFENGNIDEYDDFSKVIDYVTNNNLFFIKFLNGNRRWKEFNPNPQGRRTDDCSLRAYCAAFDIDWNKAYDIACQLGKQRADVFNSNQNCEKVILEHFNWQIDKTYKPKKDNRITVNEFAMTHPYGIFILHVHGHLVTVKNGEYYDTWDSGDKKVTKIYKPKE